MSLIRGPLDNFVVRHAPPHLSPDLQPVVSATVIPPTSAIACQRAASPTSGADADSEASTDSPRHDVQSLRDQMQWADANAKHCDQPTVALTSIAGALASSPGLSSTFSSLSPEHVAIGMLVCTLERITGTIIAHPHNLFAIEDDVEARFEQRMCNAPACSHTKITDFVKPQAQQLIASLAKPKNTISSEKWRDRVMEILLDGGVATSSYCQHHCKHCTLQRAGLHFASFSSSRVGMAPYHLLVFVALRTLLLEPVVLVDCCVEYGQGLLRRYLGRWYDVCGVSLNSTAFGVPYNKDQHLVLLTLRSHCVLAKPLDDMVSTWTRCRSSSHTWRSLLHATDRELRAEIMWAQSRLPGPLVDIPADWKLTEQDFISSLTCDETERLQHLHQVYDMTKSVVSLNPEPGGDIHVASACTDNPHCFCRLGGVQWLPEFGRWATVRECLLASSFPVSNAAFDFCLEGCSRFHDLCSFNRTRSSADLPPRDRFFMSAQSARTSCVVSVGSAIMWALLHVVESTPLPRTQIQPQLAALMGPVQIDSTTDEESTRMTAVAVVAAGWRDGILSQKSTSSMSLGSSNSRSSSMHSPLDAFVMGRHSGSANFTPKSKNVQQGESL